MNVLRRHWARWSATFGIAVWSLSLAAISASAQSDRNRDDQQGAQIDTRKYSVNSELTKGNLSRVAASAGQIREVLIKNTGLIVELKRWIARDAADSGQIVEDSSLTDDAVFERLEHDVQFRSYATLLLQRFGYLTPTVNPESELGKQQELSPIFRSPNESNTTFTTSATGASASICKLSF